MSNVNEEKCYKIYVHINKINGKRYIGQTKQSLEQRFRYGEGYKKSPKFYGAIRKYGWNGFEHILLFDELTLEEANKKEEELIKKYDTTNDLNGYNIAYGGDNHVQSEEAIYKMKLTKNKNKDNYDFYKEVFQYDKDGYLIEKFESLREAERKTGVSRRNISACCNNKAKSAGGFLWSNIYKEDIKYDSLKQRQVDRYDKNGVYIDSFINAQIAGKELNIEPSSIYACCNKTRSLAGNYIWKFHNDKSKVQKYENSLYKKVKQIDRYTLQVIKEYDSVSIASNETGIRSTSISSCCKKRLKTAGNYIWRYVDDESNIDLDDINKRQPNKNMIKVNVYKNNVLVHIFNSNTDAAKSMKELYGHSFNSGKISEVCHRKRQHYYNFVFRYDNDDEFKI